MDLLKAQHIPGTRQWLYNDMEKWLQLSREEQIATSDSSDAAESPAVAAVPLKLQNKIYMLLAQPGMGKSIFGAMVEGQMSERSDQGIKVVSADLSNGRPDCHVTFLRSSGISSRLVRREPRPEPC